MYFVFNPFLFADAGTLVNATGNYVNAGTGATTAFDNKNTLAPGMKTYYETEMLENSREELIFAQLGKHETLPANHGKSIEWRKWNTMPDLDVLTEGVIPTGKKLGQTVVTANVAQYGEYVSVTDQLDLHHVDPVILGATEELGAAGTKTMDKNVRAELMTATNVIIAPTVDLETGLASENDTVEDMCNSWRNQAVTYMTADLVAKAATQLRKNNAPTFAGGRYVAVINPSCTYDLRKDKDWVEAHKYSATTEIFNGEIGELHGVRFVETTLAPITIADESNEKMAVYTTFFLGKDAFAVVDPEGAGMQTIVHDASEAGGPLNQFSTIGVKMEMAAKILYQERIVAVKSNSSYSFVDAAN